MARAVVIVRALVPLGLEEELDPLAPVAAALSIAMPCAATVEVFILGRSPSEAIAEEALRRGASSVHLVTHARLSEPATTAQFVAAFSGVLQCAAAVSLLPPGPAGEEIAARLAVRLDGSALGRCAAIEIGAAGLQVRRAAFGGRALATLRCPHNAFATMRMSKVANAQSHSAGSVSRIHLDARLPEPLPVSRREIGATRRRLEGARVVVSGGRGMAGPEGFVLLERLAASLDGALGGSLPSVDAGWVPVAHQVGQSGKFVTPEIYLAIGISGTLQHLAGVGPDARIVAINKDGEADIFRVAEVGVAGDWKEIVPALIARLEGGGA